ncbi:carbohydrate ABC transporter permease [Pseudarthrobacter quantipunctorum]|uniref:Sugar ABC transporter permease n=1 Tax=Pseudarthrobacter quantipunctorum TaxID=3128980 RepID=A0ABZ2R5I0_9MICC
MTAATTTAPLRASRRTAARRGKKSWSKFGLVALTPFALFLLLFGVYPAVELFRMATSEVQVIQGGFQMEFAGLDNFSRILTDPDTLPVLFATVVFIIGAVVFTVVLGTMLAVMLDRAVFMKTVAKRILIWPTVVAPVVVSVIWLLLLSPTIGAVNKVLLAVGLPEQGWLGEPVGAMLSILAVDVWHWTPLVFLLVYTSLQSIDTEILEAARVDGASEWQSIKMVVLPMVLPVIITSAVIRLIMSVKAFDEMFLLTHGGPGNATNLISLHIRTIFFDRLELGYGSALGVAIILIFAVLGALYVLAKKAVTGRRTSNA